MDKPLKFPFYAKASLIFIGLYAFISMLYIAKGIIIPFIFAVIIATVLHPAVNFFVRKKLNRVVAIIITLFLSIIIIAAFGTFFFTQASHFGDSWPMLDAKFTEIFNQSVTWASGYLDISPEKINLWISGTKDDLINASSNAIGQTLVIVGGVVAILLLIPVYIFMLLFYQPLLLEFLRRLFGSTNRNEVSEIISRIKTVIQSYLTGLVIEAAIVATLNSVGLLVLGIDYAILLGVIGAFLNVIPYIGGLVAVALPMLISLATKTSPLYPLYVLAIYYFIQLIDNNYIVPKIVASKVKINALISFIVVLAFGTLWGIPGMFLSIPLVGILKVICDRIESLKPWGFLLGDTMPAMALFNLPLIKEIGKPTKKSEENPTETPNE